MKHIGQEWRRKHMMFALEANLMKEKHFRDAWTDNLTEAILRLKGEPLAKSIPNSDMLQRKVAAWKYNQYGQGNPIWHRIPTVDPEHGITGVAGTRQWVPWINRHYFTMNIKVKGARLFVHRVHWRGMGTDPHLNKGRWAHRWNKVLEKDVLQKNRI